MNMHASANSNILSITGILQQFVFMSIGIVWIFLLLVVFWTVWFPIHARRFKTTLQYKVIQVVIILIAIITPLVPIVSTVTTGGYTLPSFPPVFLGCSSGNPAVVFYPFIFVLCIVLPIGFTLILLTLWKLFSASDTKKKVPA